MARSNTVLSLVMTSAVFCAQTACNSKSETAEVPATTESGFRAELPVAPNTPIDQNLLDQPHAPEVSMFHLGSDQAPFACDAFDEQGAADILGSAVKLIDYTAERKPSAPVESSCLIGYGEHLAPDVVTLDSSYVRVDVYTDRSYREQGWGALQDQWDYRFRDADNRVVLEESGAHSAWVESDHPPDPALLVRMGDVMFEVGYWPPSSSHGNAEVNEKIERIANGIVGKMKK